jgi:hypothetical protein
MYCGHCRKSDAGPVQKRKNSPQRRLSHHYWGPNPVQTQFLSRTAFLPRMFPCILRLHNPGRVQRPRLQPVPTSPVFFCPGMPRKRTVERSLGSRMQIGPTSERFATCAATRPPIDPELGHRVPFVPCVFSEAWPGKRMPYRLNDKIPLVRTDFRLNRWTTPSNVATDSSKGRIRAVRRAEPRSYVKRTTEGGVGHSVFGFRICFKFRASNFGFPVWPVCSSYSLTDPYSGPVYNFTRKFSGRSPF